MNQEKIIKRWLKRKISFTVSLLVTFLITGVLAYSADPEIETLKTEIANLKAKIEKIEGERNYYSVSSESKTNLKGEQAKGRDVLVIGPGNDMPTDVNGNLQPNRDTTVLGTNNTIKYLKYDKYDGSAEMVGDVYSTTVLGNKNKLTEPVATVVGSDNTVTAREAVVVGNNIKTTPDARSAVSIGFYSSVQGYAPVALGDYAHANAGYAIAIGKSAESNASRSITLGALSKADASGGVALGWNSSANVTSGKYAYAPDAKKPLATEEDIAEYLGKLAEYKDLKAKIEAASDVKALEDEAGKALSAYMEVGKQIDLERAKIVDAKTEKDRQDILDKISELSKEHQAKRKEYNEKNAAYAKNPNKEQYEKDKKNLSELLSVMRSSAGAVSVGNSEEGIKRQITNVAGGTEDSDAVNVAQLKKLKSYVDSKTVNYYGISSESGTNLNGEQAKGRDVVVIGPGNTMPADIDGNVVASYDTTVVGSNNKLEFIGKNKDKFTLGNHTISNVLIGNKNQSLGYTNIVLGDNNKAYGSNATVLGNNNKALGQRAIVIGDSAKALGADAIAQGFAAKAGDSSVSIGGYSKAEPVYSVSIGNEAVATKAMGVALGSSSLADRGSRIYAYTPSFEKELKTEEDIAEYLGVKEKYNELKAKIEANSAVKQKYDEYITAVNERSEADNKVQEEKTKIFEAKTKEEKQKVLDNLAVLQKEYDEKRKIELEKQDAYYKDPQYEAYKKDSAEMSNLLSTMRSSSSAVSVGSTKEGIKRQIINVAGGTEDSDAVNVAQLKSVVKYVKDIENHFPVNYVDKDGKKVVKAFDGKYYLEENLENGLPKEGATAIEPKDLHHALINTEGKPSDSVLSNVADGKISKDSKEAVNGSQLYVTNQKIDNLYDPAAEGQEPKLKGLKFVGNKKTEEYKKTLGEEVSILGDAGNAAKSADFSTKNVLTENKADGVYVMISDKPEFKSVTLNDGKSPATLTSDDKGNLLINGKPIATSSDVAASKVKYFSVNSTGGGNEENDGAKAQDAIAIGKDAKSEGWGAVALGKNAQTTNAAHEAISIGEDSKSSGYANVAIGNEAKAEASKFATAIGFGAKASQDQSTAIGVSAQSSGKNSSAFGSQSKASGENATALGTVAKAEQFGSIAIGQSANATSTAYKGIAIGAGSYVGKPTTNNPADQSVPTFGHVTKLSEEEDKKPSTEGMNQQNAMAIGMLAKSFGYQDTAIGAGAEAYDTNSLAIGIGAQSKGDYSTALGKGSKTFSERAQAMGYFSTAKDKDSLALGPVSYAGGVDSVAIGHKAHTEDANSVALGANSFAIGAKDGKAVFSNEDVKKSAGIVSVGNTEMKVTDKDGKETTVPASYRRMINLAGGIDDNDAVNVMQLKAATKKLDDLYEDKTDKDGNPVDEKGNPLVKGEDGKYYPKNPDGTANTENGPVEPAKQSGQLKGIKFVGNVNGGEYKKTLGDEVAILGNTSSAIKAADFSVTNVLTENTKDGLLIKMSDKPLFKEVVVKDGEKGPSTTIKPGNVTVTNGEDGKDGKSSSLTPEGMEVKDGKDGENGKAVYGKDGISITGPKGENGADGKTTTIKVDKEGNVVIGKDGTDSKVITEPDLTNKINASKVELKDGKNTTVEKDATVTDHTVYKVNVEGNLTDITSVSNGNTKVSLENNSVNVNNAKITNVAAGVADTDAVNVGQLKDSISSISVDKKDLDNLYEGDKDNRKLKGLKFTGNVNTAEYKKTLGDEVKILGNSNVTEEKKADYSTKNVLTENTKDGILIKMNDKPEFKEVTVKDGEKSTTISPDGVTTEKVTLKDEKGNSEVLDAETIRKIKDANDYSNAIENNSRKIREVEQNSYRGTAHAIAQSGVKFQEIGVNEMTVGAAVGYYKGEGAVAVGVQGAPTENTRLHGTVSLTPGHNTEAGFSVGASWKFNLR